MLRTWMMGAASFAVLVSAHAYAQASQEVTLFSRGHFTGTRTTITGPTQFKTPFVMKSVTIPAGTSWEFCSGNTYSGCRQLSQSTPATIMTVRSARPIAPVITSTATAAGTGAGQAGQSLRGLASEFFVAPDENGSRIEVATGAAGAGQRARDFCRTRGWRSSAHQRLQSVGGRFYLADVLCVDAGD
jgi:hypothetical protein